MNIRGTLKSKLTEGVRNHVFPGAVVGYVDLRTSDQPVIISVGNFTYNQSSPVVTRDTLYDVASLTKAIPTACLALMLAQEGRLVFDEKLTHYLPEYTARGGDAVTIRHLLSYNIVLDYPMPGFAFESATPQEIVHNTLTRQLKHPAGTRTSYSNAPMLLLGFVIERITGETLDVLGKEYFFDPLGMHATTFNPPNHSQVPPTEITDWRGVVQGCVHDETAHIMNSLKPVGCAGLFSTVPDLLTFITMLLRGGVYNSKHFFNEATIQNMYTNQSSLGQQPMGLGWEIAQPRFMGSHTSQQAFGKTGFTGTACVVDLARARGAVLLSNRTYPQRGASTDGINAIRREIFDTIFSYEH